MPPAKLRDRFVLRCLAAIPFPLARHAMSLLRFHPALADHWGYHIRPIHYYEPLPDFSAITDRQAKRRRVPQAVDFDLAGQLRLMERLGHAYGAEVAQIESRGAFDFTNDYFPGLDAAVYYALIRDLRPACVMEIGAGFSTRIGDQALQRNRAEGHDGELVCIEPFPQPRLTDHMPQISLVEQPVEAIDLEFFDRLQANDILMIDSSHTVKFGGDVCREFLEILPRLKPGVWIHVHDIFFPFDYPSDWLVARRLAWTEQYLLEAFLSFNSSFTVRAGLSWLWAEHREDLAAGWPASILDQVGGTGPASFWMLRRG